MNTKKRHAQARRKRELEAKRKTRPKSYDDGYIDAAMKGCGDGRDNG